MYIKLFVYSVIIIVLCIGIVLSFKQNFLYGIIGGSIALILLISEINETVGL